MQQEFCHLNTSLEQRFVDSMRQLGDVGWAENLCRCAPMVIDLLMRYHGQPVMHLEPAIRELILERCMIGSAPSCHRSDPHVINRHVKLVLAELEKLRRQQLAEGDWSDAPVPQQYFG